MPRFGRKLPSEFVDKIPPGQKILSWGSATNCMIAATTEALIVVGQDQTVVIPWGYTVRASWNAPVLHIAVQYESGQPSQQLTWTLIEPGLLPEAIHDRVNAAVIVQRTLVLPNLGKVVLMARRLGDQILWSVLPEREVGQLSEEDQGRIDLAVAQARSDFGI